MAYKDNRNWAIYNERLVRRGEFYLSLEFLDSWDKELKKMNQGRRGRFEYPEVFVQFSALWYIFFHLPYRQLEGALRKLSSFIPELIEVTDERTTDHEMLEPLLKDINVKDALLDCAYDTEDVFKFFKRKGVDPPGIKIRKNASRKGLSDRAFAVREFQNLGV